MRTASAVLKYMMSLAHFGCAFIATMILSRLVYLKWGEGPDAIVIMTFPLSPFLLSPLAVWDGEWAPFLLTYGSLLAAVIAIKFNGIFQNENRP